MTTPPKKLLDLPFWKGPVTTEPLVGGRSNEAYIASDDTGKCVVRFCHDIAVHHVYRDHEAMVSKASAKAGFSPDMTFYQMDGKEGTMVFEFITAKTYDKPDVAENLAPLVNRLRDFHHKVAETVSGQAHLFDVFHVISDYIMTLDKSKAPYSGDLEKYKNISAQLKAVQIPELLIFGHNDLVPQNILDDGKKIWLIDFEYAAFSTPLSDLANLASNAGFSPEQDQALLQLYYGQKATGEQTKALAALKCALMLRETMWSMVSEIHLNVPGVDYQRYTGECLEALNIELENYQKSYGKLTP